MLGYNKEIIDYKPAGMNRSGWLFQQLLKLNADTFTTSKHFLTIDSDTVLINDHVFVSENNKFVLRQSEEWHPPYFETFKKIFSYKASAKSSFVAHMMIFNKGVPFYNLPLPFSSFSSLDELEKKYGRKYKSISFHNPAIIPVDEE